MEMYSCIATSLFYLSFLVHTVIASVFLQVHKNVFVVFYSGESVKSKILKICDAFGANRYPFSDDLSKQLQTITEVNLIFSFRFPLSFQLLLSLDFCLVFTVAFDSVFSFKLLHDRFSIVYKRR